MPFASEEDDRQASESLAAGQVAGGESGGLHDEQTREGSDYDRNEYSRSQAGDQQDRSYEPVAGKRDDGFAPETGRLKSSVKYESQNDPNYGQNYYEGNSWDSGGQSNYQLTDDAFKQNNEDETGYDSNSNYNSGMFEAGLSHPTVSKSVVPYLPPDYSYETSSWHAPTSHPHDTKSLLKALINSKLKKKHPKSWPVYHHHHLDPHLDSHYPEEDVHHYEHPPPPPPPPPDPLQHEKDELALVKELITNLLVENKHKIFKILKLSKLSHLVVGKQFLAAILKILFGKGLIAKKHLIIVAYKKCYIKIKTVDLLLIPGMPIIWDLISPIR